MNELTLRGAARFNIGSAHAYWVSTAVEFLMAGKHETDLFNGLTPVEVATLAEVHGTFLQFLQRNLGSRSDAEEVMQQFYLRVVVHASELRKEESALAWLWRVLRSALSDHRRRGTTRMRAETEYARLEGATLPAIDDMYSLACMCLHKLLPVLKSEYAEILRRVDLDNELRAIVAADLGISPANLAVRLHRARQALRRALQMSCETCPIHGYLDCGCEYTKRLRSGHSPALQ